MDFELKDVSLVGGVKTVDSLTSSQLVKITIGVVGCPYDDIQTKQVIEYVFDNSLSVGDAKIGAATFAASWVATNYPNI